MQMPHLRFATFYVACLFCQFSWIINIPDSSMFRVFLYGEVISAAGSSSPQSPQTDAYTQTTSYWK